MTNAPSPTNGADRLAARLKMLTPAQVQRIDELLAGVGEYGEVHLIVQHGQLRYLNQVQSHKVSEDSGLPKK